MPTLRSLQTGKVRSLGDHESKDFLHKAWESASLKTPTHKPVAVSANGLQDDEVSDTKHHGGPDKAVFANSYHNYEKWAAFLGKESLPFGALAENLTIEGLHESSVCLGDIHMIGTVKLQVVQPRKPCWKISRRWKNKAFTKEIHDSGLTGWYYKVLQEGVIQSGNSVQIDPDVHRITILQANEAFKHPRSHLARIETILGIDAVAQNFKQSLLKSLDQKIDPGYMATE